MQKALSILEKISTALVYVISYLLAAILCVQVLLVFATVVFRYFLNRPLTWSDELAAFLLVYITFLGCFVAANTGRLAKVELVLNKMGRYKKFAQILAKLAGLVLIGVICFYGYMFHFSPIIQNQRTPAMRLPMSYFFWITPVMMTLLFFTETVSLLRLLLPKEPEAGTSLQTKPVQGRESV